VTLSPRSGGGGAGEEGLAAAPFLLAGKDLVRLGGADGGEVVAGASGGRGGVGGAPAGGAGGAAKEVDLGRGGPAFIPFAPKYLTSPSRRAPSRPGSHPSPSLC